MKSFNVVLTEQGMNQLFTLINVAIRASGLQQEEISRLGFHMVDELRKNATEIPATDNAKVD